MSIKPTLITGDCHAESLDRARDLRWIVAEAFVNVTDPNLASDAILPPTLGASTIHSAELRCAQASQLRRAYTYWR